jgi:hypothetical protein
MFFTKVSVVISGSVAVAMQPTQIQNNPEEEFLVSLKPWPGHFQILRFSPVRRCTTLYSVTNEYSLSPEIILNKFQYVARTLWTIMGYKEMLWEPTASMPDRLRILNFD